MIDAFSLILFEKLVNLLPNKYLDELSLHLRVMESRTPAKVWVSRFFLIFFLSILLFPIVSLLPQFIWLIFFLILICFIYLFYPFWKSHELSNQILDNLPSAFLSASSSIQSGQTPEEVFVFLSKKANFPLDVLFQKTISVSAQQRIELGKSLQRVLSVYNSSELSRVSSILAAGISSGANLHYLFNTVARDLLSMSELRKEQVRQMRALKYILILSGLVLIPCILSLSVQLSSVLDYSSTNLFVASQLSFFPFSIILAVIIAYFCDFSPQRTFIYIPLFVFLQFIFFHYV